MADQFIDRPPRESRLSLQAHGGQSLTHHAGLKDWRKGGKPVCGFSGHFVFLAPSPEAFWRVEERRRCLACEAHGKVAKARPTPPTAEREP